MLRFGGSNLINTLIFALICIVVRGIAALAEFRAYSIISLFQSCTLVLFLLFALHIREPSVAAILSSSPIWLLWLLPPPILTRSHP